MKETRPITDFKFTQEEYDAYMRGEEVWKVIEGFLGNYYASTLGRIKSIAREVKGRRGYDRFNDIILKNSTTNVGYYRVTLFLNNKRNRLSVHRIIADTFLNNPENKPQVNHENGNKQLNHLVNLTFVTASENRLHAFRTGLQKPSCTGQFGKDHHCSKPINQYTMKGEFIRYWESASVAQREIGILAGNISANAVGKILHSNGFIWKFAK